jgi:uncharacterized protein YegL
MSTDFDAAEIDDSNPGPRCPGVLLLDTSGSMDGERIKALKVLAQIGPRQPLALNGLAFREMFQWLSTRMRTVSRAEVDAEVPLQTPIGWAKA